MFLNSKCPNIIVFGDIMLDHQIYGSIEKLANEAPIPVLHKSNEKYSLGGCGNVLANLHSLGCNNIFLFSMNGCDSAGKKLEELLDNYKIIHYLIKNGNTTTIKHRFFCNNRIIFRYDEEEYTILQQKYEDSIYEKFVNILENTSIDSIIFSDYNKGFLTDSLCKRIIAKANMYNIFSIVDPKNNYEKYKYCSLIKPNRNEVKKIFDIDISLNNLESTLLLIKEKVQCKNVVITLAEKGICFLDEKYKYYFDETDPIDVIDVTGAGDIVNSIISYFFPLVEKKEFIIKISSYLATKSVKYAGTYMLTREDILSAINNYNDNKLINLDESKYIKKAIIFTNGCFDILHKGHLELLKFCKNNYKNSVVIVGLNSDSSIKRLKGSSRTINNLDSRIQMLNSIVWVDYILVFEEDNPIELLKILQPHVLVKGGDYTYDSILGKEYCKEVKIFSTLEGFSTTNIINKINS
jgi:D-beta-D-heptose 7-phosphate kinase/D-beta-D-heptose 1-phosphate adenosyltransferase